MNGVKLLFFIVSITLISCKKEIATTKSKANLEIITNEIVPDSTNTKIEKEELKTSDNVKEVVYKQESKTNLTSDAKVNEVEEVANKTINANDDNKDIETLEKINVEQEEKVTSEIVKEGVLPKQNVILKAGIEYINAVEFKEKIEGNNVQLIDVRTPKEFTNERIKGAININYYKKELFKKEMAKLDRSKPVYVYCRSGVRSSRSAKILKNAGFNVYDLKGGILDWKRNDLETIK